MQTVADFFDAEQLPLHTCWRCPLEVIQAAQQIVRRFATHNLKNANSFSGTQNSTKPVCRKRTCINQRRRGYTRHSFTPR